MSRTIRGRRRLPPEPPFLFPGRGYARRLTEQEQQEDASAAEAARAEDEEVQEAKEVMSDLEEGEPPKDLADWPGGKAKYLTYGGPDGGESYDDGATSKLGPSSLRHHEDGSVTIEGEEVDDPDEYKGEPIPGGPSDPDAPPDPAMVGEDEDETDDKDSERDSG